MLWQLLIASLAARVIADDPPAAHVVQDTPATTSDAAAASTGVQATSGGGITGNSATAFTDGQCSKPVGGGGVSYEFKTGFPAFDTYKARDFPGAETPDNGGGWIVYWSIPQPQPGCRNIVMVPYTQPAHDQSQPGPGGFELVNTDRAGCFSSTIHVDEDVLLSYCCGAGDCGSASLGSGHLQASPIQGPPSTQKRDVAEPRGIEAPSGTILIDRDIKVEAGKPIRIGGSLAARASMQKKWLYPRPPAAPQHSDCSFAPGTPYPRLGRQVVVSPWDACNHGDCPFQAQHQTSQATTISSSHEQTITNSVGASVSVGGGIDFLADAEVTATLSTDWSKAITDTTGKDVQTGNSTSMQATINVQAGTNVAVTFTPLFQCWTGSFDCGHGKNDGIDLCQPMILADGFTQDGAYRAVTAP